MRVSAAMFACVLLTKHLKELGWGGGGGNQQIIIYFL